VFEVFPWFTKSIWQPLPEILAGAALLLGFLAPLIEIAFALGFFSRRYRNYAILGSASMLVLVLVAIGPLGNDWNSVVWPWNLAIFAMVLALFAGTTFSFKAFWHRARVSATCLVAFALFWVVPLGNLFGITDHYLSWSLYSGHVPEATLTGDPETLAALSQTASGTQLSFARWSLDSVHVVPYPEHRVFRAIFQSVCENYPNDESLQLIVYDYPFFNSLDATVTSSRCE
jgi:hypothetical protein